MMATPSKHMALGLGFALSVLVASTACAEVSAASGSGSGYTALDAPLGSPVELEVEIVGSIAARCEMTSSALLVGDVDLKSSGETRADFGLNCNAPFTVQLRSQSGAFVNAAPPQGILDRAAYEVSVDVVTDNGRRELGWCDAEALAASAKAGCAFSPQNGGWSSGEETAIGKSGTVRLRWNDNDRSAPLFGDYRDQITIELKVRA